MDPPLRTWFTRPSAKPRKGLGPFSWQALPTPGFVAIFHAVRALCAFPHMRFAGLDVALVPEGPVLIEVNVHPDSIGALTFDLALKDYFEGV